MITFRWGIKGLPSWLPIKITWGFTNPTFCPTPTNGCSLRLLPKHQKIFKLPKSSQRAAKVESLYSRWMLLRF